MALLNLTLVEFLAIFLPISAAVVALYLYDRSRRRQVVSTLRFFPQVIQAPVLIRRKKIQQPWSLLLQLICLALLLLAIAELAFRRPSDRSRDHVLILETSAWMSSGGRTPLMELARRRALDYLRAVPAEDRVLILRADALATPVTPFTRNRGELEDAIRNSQPGWTALNLSSALELARSAQKLSSPRPGEIAFIGSGRVMKSDLERIPAGEEWNLRVDLLGSEPNDCGIRKLSARRSATDPFEWEIDVGAYNYGAAERRPLLRLHFAGARITSQYLRLPAHSAADSSFRFRSVETGLLEAFLDSKDEYSPDNRAAIELPRLTPLKVQVYSAQPARWRPLLTATRFLDPEFRRPSEYKPTGPAHRLVIVDGFTPLAAPDADAVFIPALDGTARSKVQVRHWNPAHPIAARVFNKDLRLNRAKIVKTGSSDVAIAESETGPILVASSDGPYKKLLFGFHPLEEGTDNHLAVPLLFANLVRWVSPDLFRLTEVRAGPPGLIELETPEGIGRGQVQVSSSQIHELPFTLVENRLRFFAGHPGIVRVGLPQQEVLYSLNLPEIGEVKWTPPATARHGVPPPAAATPLGIALWPWLALAGGLGLILEWVFFGRHPVVPAPSRSRLGTEHGAATVKEQSSDLQEARP